MIVRAKESVANLRPCSPNATRFSLLLCKKSMSIGHGV
jgi:hypothetical protein